MGFIAGISAIQVRSKRYTATHILIVFMTRMSAIQIGTGRCTATHMLDEISWHTSQ